LLNIFLNHSDFSEQERYKQYIKIWAGVPGARSYLKVVVLEERYLISGMGK
jgi:hypothetical protein